MTDLARVRRIRLAIAGQVQGVGFRPTVYRLARRLGLTGWIVNDTRGAFRQHGELLKRVLIHLVVNAYESIEQSGKITLTVEQHSVTDDGLRRFAVRVIDTGGGIDGEAMKDIWLPFYSTKDNHVGLGLPYVTAAAAVMDMETELVSSAGRGTSVGLLLTEQGG